MHATKKVVLKKALGLGMITEDLSLTDKFKLAKELGFDGVGWYFDIGNVLRYGWPEHWIKTLNRRIMKLHIKEFSRELINSAGLWEGFKVDLLKGDNNWPVVMKAVSDINHQGGWLTAEVSGGDRNLLPFPSSNG